MSTTQGELEGHAWWEEHQSLFERARLDYGVRHPALYDLERNEHLFISERLRAAVQGLWNSSDPDETSLKALISETNVVGVYSFDLFTSEFITMLLDELEHYESSGIPLRRPNGMNRFGCILNFLGFDGFLDRLRERYLRPLGQMLFPELVGAEDAVEHYGFVVRYKVGEDLSLAEHSDASVLTLNVCLGREFNGGELAFKGVRVVDDRPQEREPTKLSFKPGKAANSPFCLLTFSPNYGGGCYG